MTKLTRTTTGGSPGSRPGLRPHRAGSVWWTALCLALLAVAPALSQRNSSLSTPIAANLNTDSHNVSNNDASATTSGKRIGLGRLDGPAGNGANSTGPNNTSPNNAAESVGPLNETGGCGDVLSTALRQDGDGNPCWADIRSVDRWNTKSLAYGPTIHNGPGFLPASLESPSVFTFALGGLGGLLFPQPESASAYGGAAAISGFFEHPRWELMYEDGGSLGNYQLNGSSLVGLNRAAVRANVRVNARWLMQGSATNAYGNDTLRLFAPLDYRTVGATEAPVSDTVAYGLHAGNLVDQQEDLQLTTNNSRRSNWNFAAAHTFRDYSDDGVQVQTVRGRAEYIHAISENAALGVLAAGSHQDGPSACSLGGAGLLGLMKWGSAASLDLTAKANGASAACGKSVQFTGDASLYIRAGLHDGLYLIGNRDLSNGVVENLALLDSAGGGIQHQFNRSTSIRLDAAAIYGTNPKTNIAYNGEFAEAAITYPLGGGFLQETSYRHYQVSKVPGGDNRDIVTFTLWWSPGRNRQTLLSH